MKKRYRGRLAPSPTGLLHLGHARTFWIAYQRALAANGVLVLRNDDLDRDRSRPEFAAAMIEDLHWLGICWREGPDVGGFRGPYTQSERHGFYLEVWRRLLRSGRLYPCRCSRRDLADAAQAPHGGEEAIYPGTCRPRTGASVEFEHLETPGETHWRFSVNPGEAVEFEDGNAGRQRFVAGKDFGDFLVWRRDGIPSYQLAAVADDDAMGITEVVRGADLLVSTARQILLARALGFASPSWYHCELMLDDRGKRLAKRCDSLSLRGLREQGKRPTEVLSLLKLATSDFGPIAEGSKGGNRRTYL